jgi:arabinofuranosyltransferase
MADPPASWPLRVRWVVLAMAAIVLVGHSLAYNFVTDDAYISFVFSRNLAEHGQLAFNLGHPVEGYTNFLWTFVLGVAMLAGIQPEWSSRVLGTACALATLYVVFRLMERALGRKSPWAAVPPLLLACSSGFACWTSGGLETQLYTLLVAAALDALVAAATRPRALRRLGVILALASMTRPEGPLIAAVLGVAWVAVGISGTLAARRVRASEPGPAQTAPGRRRFVEEALAVAWFLALWAPWFAWRWWYYGWPFPNTYYVKATGPWAGPDLPHQMTGNGLYYVWLWLRQTHLLHVLPIAVVGLAFARPRTPRFVLTVTCTLFAAVYLAYTVSVGGDFMGLHRFIMPMFVVAALAVTLGAEWIAGKLRHRAAGPAIAVLLVGAFAVTQASLTRESLRWGNFANDRGIDTPAFLIVYTEDRAAIGRAMAGCFRSDDFSIVGGAGAQPYFARMRGVDVFGLVSETIAHDEPRIRARAGHTKFGSDRVLAAYDPTFVFSCYQIHREPAQPALPCAAFWLARGFEPVTMHIPGMREQGEYYTFLARKTRNFECPGRVP